MGEMVLQSDLSRFDNPDLNMEIMAEEAAEVIEQLVEHRLARVLRIKSKIVRFGLDDYHPKNGKPNRESLTEELGHLLGMIDILVADGTIDAEALEAAKRAKFEKLPVWYSVVDGG